MNVTLKGFSQETDLADPKSVKYFLSFEFEKKVFRLPVQQETVMELIQTVYGEGTAEAVREEGEEASPSEDEESHAEFFSADDEDSEEEEDNESPPATMRPEEFLSTVRSRRTPESEDDVPSL